MTDIEWRVSTPTENDIDALSGVIHGCGLFTPEEAEGFAESLPGLLVDPAQHWRILKRGTEAVGAAYLSLDGMSGDVWNLWFIALLPEARGEGGGTRLVSAAEQVVRAGGGRMLLVETSSAEAQRAARAFYAARGYEEEGRVRDYYAPGEAKVIFRRLV